MWLTNVRGNVYSRRHATLNPNVEFGSFWEFSWYEIGIYDNPAVIDRILAVTCCQKLYYVGFSQGTTSLLVMLSERPEYNEKIRMASLLAPVAYIGYADSIYQLIANIGPFLDVSNFNKTSFILTITIKI